MYTVKLFRKAETELNEACEWYDDKAAGLGAKFLSVIDLKLKLIEKQPLYYNVRFSENIVWPQLMITRILLFIELMIREK